MKNIPMILTTISVMTVTVGKMVIAYFIPSLFFWCTWTFKTIMFTDFGVQTRGSGANPNQQTSSNKMVSFQPQEKMFKKFASKINVDEFKLTENSSEDKLRVKDKKDRATAEQVMDPRTRMILFKLMNRGFITQINGCISTGKEANVYHATGKDDEQLALKIYKTSILVFKDRDKYVTGEFR